MWAIRLIINKTNYEKSDNFGFCLFNVKLCICTN